MTFLYIYILVRTYRDRNPFLKRFFPCMSFLQRLNPFDPAFIFYYIPIITILADIFIVLFIIKEVFHA